MDRVNPNAVVPMIDLNPLSWLGDKAKEGLADGWTAAMISLWSAGMWLFEAVFQVLDRFLTPDVTDPGLANLYGVTLWISFLLALLIGFGQIGLAALRRDGASLGSLAVGLAQYGLAVTCWVSVCGGLILACAGLTTGLLEVLLGIDDFSGYRSGAGWPDKIGGTVGATALGMCSLFLLIPAGFGYVLIMLVREAALLIITATLPIAAAGALGEGTRGWMWKCIRWFVAACLTAPLLALVLGIGVQITRAAFPDGPETHDVGTGLEAATVQIPDSSSQVGMAVVGCVVMAIACFCPMALFRLLAFVDPGTSSGASFRSTLSANGGVGGLLTGSRGADQGSGAAVQSAADGRAVSEDAADTDTANRYQSTFARSFGAVGTVAAGGMRAAGVVARHGASVGVDVLGQGGVGAQGYFDTTPPSRGSAANVRPRTGHRHQAGDTDAQPDLESHLEPAHLPEHSPTSAPGGSGAPVGGAGGGTAASEAAMLG